MSIYTKLILAVIWLGCVICICSLAEFVGLAFNIFIGYRLLRLIVASVVSKSDSAHGTSLTTKTVG